LWSMVVPPGFGTGLSSGGLSSGGRSDGGLSDGGRMTPPAGFGTAAPLGDFAASIGVASGAPPAFVPSSNRAVEIHPPNGGATAAVHSVREEPKMVDVSLSDDMVKLVQFAIVSVRRDIYDLDAPEEPLISGQEVISDNLRDMDFSSYIIARYCHEIPPRDRRYIRVWYQVLERWPKASLNYEERQLRELRRIANCICRGDEAEVEREVGGEGGDRGGDEGGRRRPPAGGPGRGRQVAVEATAG
jgi:hypothetical protein